MDAHMAILGQLRERRGVVGANEGRTGLAAIELGVGLAAGDLVVHVEHGIGRFVGLKTIDAAGAQRMGHLLEIEDEGLGTS